jgi:hypothetical protein
MVIQPDIHTSQQFVGIGIFFSVLLDPLEKELTVLLVDDWNLVVISGSLEMSVDTRSRSADYGREYGEVLGWKYHGYLEMNGNTIRIAVYGYFLLSRRMLYRKVRRKENFI